LQVSLKVRYRLQNGVAEKVPEALPDVADVPIG
jgi:hypothetical protein